MTPTIPAAFAAVVRQDPTLPFLTWYDDATGDRTELSGATVDNWVSKTANLFIDGVGLGSGDAAAVLLPPHWQTAVVLLGAWSAGLAVDLGPDPQPVEVLFTVPERVESAAAWSTADRYVTGLLPLAAPLRQVPAGFVDYPVEVRGFGDRFVAPGPVLADDRALAGPVEESHQEVFGTAAERATELGIKPGDRILVDAAAYPDAADWLLAPLVAGASIVLCGNLDRAAIEGRAQSERVTLRLT